MSAKAERERVVQAHLTRRLLSKAEREGFEPSTHLSAGTRFPVAFLRPLGHLSARGERSSAFWRCQEAEGEGFEPSSDLTARNGFRDRRIRPLCHPSEAEKEGFEPSKEEISPLTP